MLWTTLSPVKSIQIDSMFTELPNPSSVDVQQVWNHSHDCADSTQNSESVMSTDRLVDWTTSNRDTTGHDISCENKEAQRRSGVYIIRIDDVHICDDENGHDAIAEDDRCDEWGPDRDGWLNENEY